MIELNLTNDEKKILLGDLERKQLSNTVWGDFIGQQGNNIIVSAYAKLIQYLKQ